jgi:hypothetical protein
MVTLTYSQEISDGGEFYFKPMSMTYKGLEVKKTDEHQLYYIVPPEGKMLPAEIGARFTKIALLKDAVDRWILDSKSAELPDIPPPPAPKRSHHKKQEEEKEIDEQDTIENHT